MPPPEHEPIIPYADLDLMPDMLTEKLQSYQARMGFLPNSLKLYMHRPEIADVLWVLNDRIMRDPSSHLDQELKRQCALIASKVNGCRYCTTHHCAVVMRRPGESVEGWDLSDQEVDELLSQKFFAKNEKHRVCMEFVAEASRDPRNISDPSYDRLTKTLTPQEIMELVALVGFWKMYNTIHEAMRVPVEQNLREETRGLTFL